MKYVDMMKKRRSRYDINNKLTVSEDTIKELFKDAV